MILISLQFNEEHDGFLRFAVVVDIPPIPFVEGALEVLVS